MTSQPFFVGTHHGGEIVDGHVTDRPLQVRAGNELIRTIGRTSTTKVRKRAE